MSNLQPWNEYPTWHALFDALCRNANHYDNARLATELCAKLNNNSQSAYTTALKNLANWRSGKHLPRRSYFDAISELIGIDHYDGLAPVWEQMFADAGKRAQDKASEDPHAERIFQPSALPESEMPGHRSASWRRTAFATAAGMLCAGVAGYGLAGMGGLSAVENDDQLSIVVYNHWALQVDDTVILHGARADRCGSAPPAWADVKRNLPPSQLGEYLDGGIAVRDSHACGGPTPVRVVRFKATHPGIQDLILYDDPISIEVQ